MLLEILAIVNNTEKEDEIFKRLGILEKKSDMSNESMSNIQKKIIEIEANAYNSEITMK